MKLNQETINIICEAIRLGATQKMAAEAAGVHESTFYEWKKRGEKETEGIYYEFAESLKKADAEGVIENLKNIREAAKNKQWQASAWILERRHPEVYGRKQEVISNGNSKSQADLIEKLEIVD